MVWGDVLVDGHNRYEICTRLGIGFETVRMEFDSRDEARVWIANNALGKRNMSDLAKIKLVLEVKPSVEALAKARQIRKPADSVRPISDEQTPIRTDDTLAAMAGVGRDTFRKGEALIATAAPEVQQAARAGAVSINLAAQFAELPPEQQQPALASNGQ